MPTLTAEAGNRGISVALVTCITWLFTAMSAAREEALEAGEDPATITGRMVTTSLIMPTV